jgi:formamidopyrimidine-DNA glycosylase
MPELPEVEILVRHLEPILRGRKIHGARVFRSRVLRPTKEAALLRAVRGARINSVRRRGKYILFELSPPAKTKPAVLVGHLGMTGRFYLSRPPMALPKHAAVVLDLGSDKLIFEDTRYFGRLTLDTSAVANLGPEPLGFGFTAPAFAKSLKRSRQPIKVKLLDQTLVAGVGNIYASEALFRARISPNLPACKLTSRQVERLRQAVRDVLQQAIRFGSTIALNHSGGGERDGLFYFGSATDAPATYLERLKVYDRANLPCASCGAKIRRIVQSARSTFFCPRCQKG